MLENLLKTWAVLAPDELEIKDGGEYILSKTVGRNIYPETVLIYDSFFEEAYTIDTLQGYIQRCINARGWRWKTGNVTGYHWALVWILEENISTLSSSPDSWIKPLLESYLKALAGQRPITQGQWKHADGDIYWVTDAHEWSGHGFYSFLNEDWSYSLEEHPNIKIQMSSSNYNASQDYGDRVFYDGDSGKWARLTSSFLGLKDDGRLRFEKIND
jgi:hypothetical protein